MPVAQDEYGSPATKQAAGVVDNGEPAALTSRTIDEAGALFGCAIFQKSNRVATAEYASGAFLGIATAGVGEMPFPAFVYEDEDMSVINDAYEPFATITILTRGLVWVLAGSTVTRDAKAYVTPLGAITAVKVGNEPIPAEFEDAGPAGGMVRLRVGAFA